MLSFFSSRRKWDSPPPNPLVPGGHTRLRVKEWGSPYSDEGTYTVVLYIYMYFEVDRIMNFRKHESKTKFDILVFSQE